MSHHDEIAFSTVWYDSLGSTNQALKERVQVDPVLPSGTVVATLEQTAGRGRGDRVWISGRGENLTASVFIRHPVDPRTAPSSAMAAAIGVARFLRSQGIAADLKWPNDVRVGERKICGILSERLRAGVVIGLGLNVNMQFTSGIDQPAVSMRMLSGRRHDPKTMLPLVLESIAPHLLAWMDSGFEGIRVEWEGLCPSIGKPVSVRDGTTRRTGMLSGFGEYGELLLAGPDDTVYPVWSGDLDASRPFPLEKKCPASSLLRKMS